MKTEKVNYYMSLYKDKIPEEGLYSLKTALTNAPDEKEESLQFTTLKSTTTTLLLSIFLGGLGVDRFYIGDVGLGIAKLLFGWLTCGLWVLLDIFFSYKKTKKKNLQRILTSLI